MYYCRFQCLFLNKGGLEAFLAAVAVVGKPLLVALLDGLAL